MLHLNLLAPSDRHRADRGDDDEQEPQPEREPDDARPPTSPVAGRGQWIAIRRVLKARPGTPLVGARTAELDEFDGMMLTNVVGNATRECGPLVAAHHMAAGQAADRIAVLDDGNKPGDSRCADLMRTNSSRRCSLWTGSITRLSWEKRNPVQVDEYERCSVGYRG